MWASSSVIFLLWKMGDIRNGTPYHMNMYMYISNNCNVDWLCFRCVLILYSGTGTLRKIPFCAVHELSAQAYGYSVTNVTLTSIRLSKLSKEHVRSQLPQPVPLTPHQNDLHNLIQACSIWEGIYGALASNFCFLNLPVCECNFKVLVKSVLGACLIILTFLPISKMYKL